MFWLGTAIFVLVMALLVYALFRRRREPPAERDVRRITGAMVVGGIALPLVVVSVVLVATLIAGQALAARAERALTVEVLAHQYWWEISYPKLGFTTANELHLPAGRPVEVRLRTADVIHSFWVPQLHGKVDMVPGHTKTRWSARWPRPRASSIPG